MLRYLFSCVYLIYYPVFSQALDESEASAALALRRFVFLIKLSTCVDEKHDVGSKQNSCIIYTASSFPAAASICSAVSLVLALHLTSTVLY